MKRRCSKGKTCAKKAESAEKKCPCGCEGECKCDKECPCREKECKECKKCPCGCEGECKCDKECPCREKECKECKKCPCGCESECKCDKECPCREKECKECKKCPCGCEGECKCDKECPCREKECKCPCGKVVVATDKAPKAIGPYSQAIKANGMLFASGQIPLDPATGELHGTDSITAQTNLIFNNIEAILKEAGTDMSKVVKTTVFMRDMNDFAEMNAEYAKHFPSDKPLPARSAVQAARLPKDVGLEVEVIALL